jgi:mannose-1-phosphate guanylyltransferase/mannose-6-phosphate isomerase
MKDTPIKLDIKKFKKVCPKVYRVHRPWGWFDKFCENADGITVKLISVNPGEALSLQRHKDRDQLYYVLDANLDVVACTDDRPIDDTEVAKQILHKAKTFKAHVGEMFFFERGVWHRAIATGDLPARYVEVAWGHNDETDIERAHDKYDR